MREKFVIIMTIVIIILINGMVIFSGCFSKTDELENNSKNNLNVFLNNSNGSFKQANFPNIATHTGKFEINATIVSNSTVLPSYRGVFAKNDSIDVQLQQIGKSRQNVTTEEEAPEAARKALEPYGGIPADAVYQGSDLSYTEIYNHTLNKSTYKEPMFISIFYSREINNMTVRGDSNVIIVTLGTNGELLWLYKKWRNYTYIGDVTVIPVNIAIEKLGREELIDSTWHPEEAPVTIDSIGQGYYARNVGNSETILEPIWMFFGKGSTGTRLGFSVYGRQFANFTAARTTGIAPLSTRFTDTSEASPDTWFWDFGDGTNSTEQNPVHTYKKTGNYTVNLTVWNDIGSDTLSKKNLVLISSEIGTPRADTADTTGIIAGNS